MLKPEKIQHHIKHLEEQLESLKKQLLKMEMSYGTHEQIVDIKKKKLLVKDEIESMKAKLENSTNQ